MCGEVEPYSVMSPYYYGPTSPFKGPPLKEPRGFLGTPVGDLLRRPHPIFQGQQDGRAPGGGSKANRFRSTNPIPKGAWAQGGPIRPNKGLLEPVGVYIAGVQSFIYAEEIMRFLQREHIGVIGVQTWVRAMGTGAKATQYGRLGTSRGCRGSLGLLWKTWLLLSCL